jgi:hypothetical protein
MTNQSPRIYIYKITFEEVLYYYYGAHIEKKFDEYYMGSPKSKKNKWCWKFYTPRKQILEVFDYTDEGWEEALSVESRIIKPIYNVDKWCLNLNCGGKISRKVHREVGQKLYEEGKGIFSLTKEEKIEIGRKTYELGIGVHGLSKEELSEAGKIGGKTSYERKSGIHGLSEKEKRELGEIAGKIAGTKNYENKVGIHGRTNEQIIEDSRKGGQRTYELKAGVHGRTKEEMSEQGRKNGQKLYEEKRGIHARTKEQMSQHSKKVATMVNSQRWKCTVTGHVSTPGALTTFQKNRGIDTSNRIRIQ